MYKNSFVKIFETVFLGLFLTDIKNISKTSIIKYAEIGSSCQKSLTNLNYFIVFSPLIMQDPWFFKIVLIQLTKSIANSYFGTMCNKKPWLSESNAFSMSTMTMKDSSEGVFAISRISKISLQLSFINLFLTNSVWFEEVSKYDAFFILTEWTLLVIFVSVLSSDISI